MACSSKNSLSAGFVEVGFLAILVNISFDNFKLYLNLKSMFLCRKWLSGLSRRL